MGSSRTGVHYMGSSRKIMNGGALHGVFPNGGALLVCFHFYVIFIIFIIESKLLIVSPEKNERGYTIA